MHGDEGKWKQQSRGQGFSLAGKSMKSMLDYSDGGRHGESRH